MYEKSERAVIRAQLVAAPMYSGPIEPGRGSNLVGASYCVAQIRTILSNKDGIGASAIQKKKLNKFHGVSVQLRRLLDDQNGMPNCWTRRDVATYDNNRNETGRYKIKYFLN
jgi:hypothetical protein